MRGRFDATLKDCRMLLTMLRTPKLRDQLATVLTTQDDAMQAADALTALPASSPVRRLAWLGADGLIQTDRLGEAVDDLTALLDDQAVLATTRIADMPADPDDRATLVRAVCGRAFENTGARTRLTEPELNARLAMLVEDVATFRRHAVDLGLLARTPDGRGYRLV